MQDLLRSRPDTILPAWAKAELAGLRKGRERRGVAALQWSGLLQVDDHP